MLVPDTVPTLASISNSVEASFDLKAKTTLPLLSSKILVICSLSELNCAAEPNVIELSEGVYRSNFRLTCARRKLIRNNTLIICRVIC